MNEQDNASMSAISDLTVAHTIRFAHSDHDTSSAMNSNIPKNQKKKKPNQITNKTPIPPPSLPRQIITRRPPNRQTPPGAPIRLRQIPHRDPTRARTRITARIKRQRLALRQIARHDECPERVLRARGVVGEGQGVGEGGVGAVDVGAG